MFFLQDPCFCLRVVLLLFVSNARVYYAGLLTAIHKECLRVLDYRELLFNDCGDRVAQLLHVQSVSPSQNQKGGVPQEFLIVNTHLLFPHDSSLCLVRLNQVCETHVNKSLFLSIDDCVSNLPSILTLHQSFALL